MIDLPNIPTKIKQLIVLLDAGKKPVIEMTKSVSKYETIEYDPGMICRCLSYQNHSMGNELVVVVNTDFSEWEELNKLKAVADWQSPNGLVKWHESDYYPKDKKNAIYLGSQEEEAFDIIEETVLFHRYLQDLEKDSDLTYVDWLESIAKKALGIDQ